MSTRCPEPEMATSTGTPLGLAAKTDDVSDHSGSSKILRTKDPEDAWDPGSPQRIPRARCQP